MMPCVRRKSLTSGQTIAIRDTLCSRVNGRHQFHMLGPRNRPCKAKDLSKSSTHATRLNTGSLLSRTSSTGCRITHPGPSPSYKNVHRDILSNRPHTLPPGSRQLRCRSHAMRLACQQTRNRVGKGKRFTARRWRQQASHQPMAYRTCRYNKARHQRNHCRYCGWDLQDYVPFLQ